MTSKKKTEEPSSNYRDYPGSELLIPPKAVRPSTAMRVVSGLDPDSEGFSVDELAPLLETIENEFVRDIDAWTEVFHQYGMASMMNLVGAYLGELMTGSN